MSKTSLQFSTYLVSKSSFISGIGNIFDFTGSYQKYNSSKNEIEADSKAILLDWLAVGDDIKDALDKFSKEKHVSAK